MHNSDLGGFFTLNNGHTTERNLMEFLHIIEFDLIYEHDKNLIY